MRPQLSESLSQGLGVESHKHDPSKEEDEDPLLGLITSLFDAVYHLLHQEVQLVDELVISAAEDQESDPLHGIASLDGQVSCCGQEASLIVPFGHLLLEHVLWSSIYEVPEDLTPLFQVDHRHLEEVIHIEQLQNVILIRLNQI